MDNEGIYEGITDFKTLKLFADLKADIAEMKTFAKMSLRKRSERMADEWINGLQVMKILNITKGTLLSYREKGTLPYTYINNKIYYRASDVDELLKSNYKKRPGLFKRHPGPDH